MSIPGLFKEVGDISPQPISVEPAPVTKKIYTVAELVSTTKDFLFEHFGKIWVEGEVSNYVRYPSGHVYFSLKDEDDQRAQIGGVMYKSYYDRLGFQLENGMRVIARGKLDIYSSKFQINAEYLEPSGLGAKQLALEQLKKKLAAEGLFDEERKKPLPLFPRTVAFVTSPSGAALRDVKNILFRRFPCRLVLAPTLVQGEGAPESIANAIAACNEYNKTHADTPIDVMIVGRGGGSAEDLWSFNEEIVARAIAASKIPVISAVGHETDTTLADYVADLRAPTPSAAAELVARPIREWLEELSDYLEALNGNVDYLLNYYAEKLIEFLHHRALREPGSLVDEYSQRVDTEGERLVNAFGRYLEPRASKLAFVPERLGNALKTFLAAKEARLELLDGKLSALGPLAVLKRGFALVTGKDGKIISTTGAAKEKKFVSIRLQDGTVDAEIL